ncbi:MAG: response regulator transcription factor [Cyanobacteriota bacterium]
MKTKPNILIIDDNPEELSFLSDFGYNLNLITSSSDILDVIRSVEGTFNLVIIDISISIFSGWEVLKFLRHYEKFQYVPVLVLTELSDKTDELLALRSGADDFVKKPFDVDLLLARIDASLRRSMWNKLAFVNLKKFSFIDLSGRSIKLTARESTILNMLSGGNNNDEIAKELCLSVLTVKTHIKNLFKKLKVNNRTEAILVGMNLGLINAD